MATVDVRMPKMGESITEGTVVTWYKKAGDPIELDENLLEIGTDKVDTDVPSPAAGTVHEILVPEGETVDVGTVIARLATSVDTAPAPVSEPRPALSEPQAAAAEVQVVMPKMGESITEGTVVSWHKNVGDAVDLDETLLEIGTDKVDTDVPSPASGFLKEIRVPEGETVPVGTCIAVLASEAVQVPPVRVDDARPSPAAELPPAQVSPTPAPPEQSSPGVGRRLGDGRFLSPLVRSIAKTEGLSARELEGIDGSGREGRLTKQDVLAYLEEGARPAAEDDRVEIVEMDRMRQLIAQHMRQSKDTAAHVTSFAEVDVTGLVRIRDSNKQRFFQQEGIPLTYTPFFVYAAVEALREHPLLNASVDGTRILLKKDFHIGVAVAIGKTGLIVPVIRHAGRQNIGGLAHAAHDVAQRARGNDLQPDDLQGGTFTVTNIGSLGSIMGTPIILQPQVGILATGAIRKRPVVLEDPELGDVIAVRSMMYVSLSYDHRIVDGAMGISFLKKFMSVLEGMDSSVLV